MAAKGGTVIQYKKNFGLKGPKGAHFLDIEGGVVWLLGVCIHAHWGRGAENHPPRRKIYVLYPRNCKILLPKVAKFCLFRPLPTARIFSCFDPPIPPS